MINKKPKLRRIRVARNAWGNINAYCGNRRIKAFGESDFDAKRWITFLEAKGHTVTASNLW